LVYFGENFLVHHNRNVIPWYNETRAKEMVVKCFKQLMLIHLD